ncbi:MAG: response regulator [bacterium]|nr:response regulator [bacterium]
MKKNLKILLGESNHYHAVLMTRELSDRCPDSRIDLFTSADSLVKACKDSSYDIVLADPVLFGPQRLAILDLLHQAAIDLPVILVTADGSEQEASEAIRSGAAEYIIKENSYYQVLPRVVTEVYRRSLLIQKNRKMEEQLQQKEQKELVKIAASTLSHEVNNPLQTILGTVELLLDEPQGQSPAINKKIRVIRESAERIHSSLTRLSNLATPAINETVTGRMVDPIRSRTYTRRKNIKATTAE